MTKTRVIAALIMAPLAICAIVLLPSQWLAALAAVLFLTGLWECSSSPASTTACRAPCC